jgi:hypothetical protein
MALIPGGKRCACGDRHVCPLHARDFYDGPVVLRARPRPRHIIVDDMPDPWLDMPFQTFGPGMFCCIWKEFSVMNPGLVRPIRAER